MKVSAAIVLYENNENEVKEVIECCLSAALIANLYLIDNSAKPRLKKLAVDRRITYIHNKENIGFGAAHNIAINHVGQCSDYHLILNPDISFQIDVIEKLVKFMDENPDIGSVMPKIYYKNGCVQRLCKLLPNPINLFGRRFAAKSRWVSQLNAVYELHDFDYEQVLDVPNLSGCFMFIRTDILQQVKGFDTRYFLYLEDTDLLRKIGRLSRTVFYPYVSVVHDYQKGSYKSNKLMYFHIVSAIKYFNKWGWIIDRERSSLNKKTLLAVAKSRSNTV